MTTTPTATYLAPLPHLIPAYADLRLLLFVFRRMGAHGLNDAHAANALLHAFGTAFRRPLMLLRAMMADVAGTATGPIGTGRRIS